MTEECQHALPLQDSIDRYVEQRVPVGGRQTKPKRKRRTKQQIADDTERGETAAARARIDEARDQAAARRRTL